MLITIWVSGVVVDYFTLTGICGKKLKADQTIGGASLNMLAPALAIVITWAIQGQGQTSISIPARWIRITPATIGLSETLCLCFLTRLF
jgi:simple sugar transport system permease protein